MKGKTEALGEVTAEWGNERQIEKVREEEGDSARETLPFRQ